jgi:hypothetical protein
MTFNIEKFFDLTNFSEEEKAQLLGSLTDLVMAKIADKVGDSLSEEKIQELESVANSGEQSAVIDWLNLNIPNFSAILDETMAEEAQNIAVQVKMLTGLALEAKNNA